MKRLIRIALALAAVITVSLVALGFVAESLFQGLVERRLKAETGYEWRVAGRPRMAFTPELALAIQDVQARAERGPGQTARFEVATVRLSGSPANILSGLRLSRIELERPVARISAEWWRAQRAVSQPGDSPGLANWPSPERIVVRDGSIGLVGADDAIEVAVSGIQLDAVSDRLDRSWSMTLGAHLGGDDLTGELTVGAPIVGDASSAPVAFTIRWPRLLDDPISGTTEARIEAGVLTLSKLSGSVAANRFSGAVIVDGRDKPSVRVDLGFPTLAIRSRANAGSGGSRLAGVASSPGWRFAPDAMRGFLSAIDGRLSLYAGTLDVTPLVFSEVAGEARLTDGTLSLRLARASLHGGELQASAGLGITGGTLHHTLEGRIDGVQGRPLLSDLAAFSMLDGTASATFKVQSTGWTVDDAARTLSGAAEIDVRDGRLNEVDLPRLARLVTAGFSGGQRGGPQSTAFDRFAARFDIREGRAVTDDMTLRGPVVVADGAGTIDLIARTLAFRIRPQISGAVSGANLSGLGVPIVVEGPWDSPTVVPDLAGLTLPSDGLPGLDAIKGLLGGGGLGKLLDEIAPPQSRPERPPQRRPEEPR